MEGGRAEVDGEVALRVEGVSKTFPGQRALSAVNLELGRGEVRALLGENGSGKSTLIKILAGYHQPDPGWRAWADGAPLQLGSAGAARAAGLRFIHQDLGLVAELDVIDNLALGEHYVGRRWLSRRREAAEAERLLSRYGVEMDVFAPVRSLSPAERTIVAVVRALRDTLDRSVLVLDEPTASLSGPEVTRLFEVIRAVRDHRGSLLYVTHRLQEVFEIADRVTVLRDGHEIADCSTDELSEDQLIEMLVGRPLGSFVSAREMSRREDVTLEVRELAGERVQDVSFAAARGEILGIAGIIGSGREELPYLLYGSRPWASGAIRIGESAFDSITIRQSIAAGMVFAGADRQRDSVIPAMLVRENLTLPRIPHAELTGWLSAGTERGEVRGWLERLDIRPSEPDRPLATLSGGNQQRVVLARWLRCEPQILLLEEPTRGVDIGAKAAIYRLIADAARDGMTVVVFSSDAEELATLCERVLVLRAGRIAGELSGAGLSEGAIVEQSIMEGSPVGA
jgi:ribose transport system ATP-binding protein